MTNWYKTAGTYYELVEQAKTCIEQAYKQIGKGQLTDSNRGNVPSFEFMDEADPRGTNYIQVYYKEQENSIGISKYYESEHMQDAYGQEMSFPFDQETCVSTIMSAVGRLQGG